MEGTAFYFSWEITLMEALQRNMGSLSVMIMSCITLLGEEMVMVAVLGFLYWCFDKKAAKKIGTAIMVGIVFNPMIKNIAVRRRPYFDSPGIKCLKPVNAKADIYDIAAQGYSFPSGHSLNSAILYGSLPLYWKKTFLRVIAFVIPLLVGISRVVLGVHYPTDVLASWIVGAVVVIMIHYAEEHVKDENLFHAILFVLALGGIFYCRTTDYFTSLGLMAGFFLSIPFEKKYVNFRETGNPLAAALRLIGGFAVYFGGNTLLKLPFSKEFLAQPVMAAFLVRTARYAVVSFIMLAIYPMLFGKIIKEKEEPEQKAG